LDLSATKGFRAVTFLSPYPLRQSLISRGTHTISSIFGNNHTDSRIDNQGEQFNCEPFKSPIRLTFSLRQDRVQLKQGKPVMLALWINTKEQRSEGSFAGYPVLSYQRYIVLPALNPERKALRC
jgi:hypothetical protein